MIRCGSLGDRPTFSSLRSRHTNTTILQSLGPSARQSDRVDLAPTLFALDLNSARYCFLLAHVPCVTGEPKLPTWAFSHPRGSGCLLFQPAPWYRTASRGAPSYPNILSLALTIAVGQSKPMYPRFPLPSCPAQINRTAMPSPPRLILGPLRSESLVLEVAESLRLVLTSS